ncbi:MAG: hypothetical protein WC089_01385 [Candidatus Paceibacterota bacterium]
MKNPKLPWTFIPVASLHDKIDDDFFFQVLHSIDYVSSRIKNSLKHKNIHVGDRQIMFDSIKQPMHYFYAQKDLNFVKIIFNRDGCIDFYFKSKKHNLSDFTFFKKEPFKASDKENLDHALALSANFLDTGNPCLD